MMVWAIVAIGALSLVVWAHHMFVSGMNPYFGFFFATTTLIIAVPTAIKVYNWLLTLWRGDIHLSVPMLFSLAFICTFVIGGLTGLFLGNVSVDIPLSGTYFVVAHFHMVMGVAPLLVVFGGIYHWFPKVTGRMLDDRLGPPAFLDHLPRHLRDLLSDALPRRAGHAAALLQLRAATTSSRRRRYTPERLHHGGRADRRRGAAAVRLQPRLERVARPARRRQPLARRLARMADAADAAGPRQLGTASCRWSIAGPMPTACRAPAEDFIAQNAPPADGGIEPAAADRPGRGTGGAGMTAGTAMLRPAAAAAPARGRRAHAGASRPASACGSSWAWSTALFSLFITAYVMRMSGSDAVSLALPWQLWLSTAWLVAGSVALQRASARGARRATRFARAACCWPAASCALAFLGVQLWAWQALLERAGDAGRAIRAAASSTC